MTVFMPLKHIQYCSFLRMYFLIHSLMIPSFLRYKSYAHLSLRSTIQNFTSLAPSPRCRLRPTFDRPHFFSAPCSSNDPSLMPRTVSEYLFHDFIASCAVERRNRSMSWRRSWQSLMRNPVGANRIS